MWEERSGQMSTQFSLYTEFEAKHFLEVCSTRIRNNALYTAAQANS